MRANVSASRAGDIAVIVEPYLCGVGPPHVIRPNGLRLFRLDQSTFYLSAAASLIMPVNGPVRYPIGRGDVPVRGSHSVLSLVGVTGENSTWRAR